MKRTKNYINQVKKHFLNWLSLLWFVAQTVFFCILVFGKVAVFRQIVIYDTIPLAAVLIANFIVNRNKENRVSLLLPIIITILFLNNAIWF